MRQVEHSRLILIASVIALFCHVNVYGRGATQASIAGVVRDASGAVLPGVTVEASSPVLIEKSRTVALAPAVRSPTNAMSSSTTRAGGTVTRRSRSSLTSAASWSTRCRSSTCR